MYNNAHNKPKGLKEMKKVISILLAVVMIVSCMVALTACGTDEGAAAGATGVKVINIPLTDELYAFGVKKDDPDLLSKVNTFIGEVKSNGQLDAILNNYFGDGKPQGVTSAVEDPAKDQLIVITNAEFAPFEYLEGETFYGVDMELAKLLADYLGKELVIKNVDFEVVCSQIDAGYGDIAMAGLTVNETRTEFVTFSESYYTACQMVIVKNGDTTFDECKTAADVEAILAGFDDKTSIGVQNGTTAQYYVEGDADWGFDGFAATCTGYTSGALAVQDMLNGNIDLVIIDEAPANSIVEAVNAVN